MGSAINRSPSESTGTRSGTRLCPSQFRTSLPPPYRCGRLASGSRIGFRCVQGSLGPCSFRCLRRTGRLADLLPSPQVRRARLPRPPRYRRRIPSAVARDRDGSWAGHERGGVVAKVKLHFLVRTSFPEMFWQALRQALWQAPRERSGASVSWPLEGGRQPACPGLQPPREGQARPREAYGVRP